MQSHSYSHWLELLPRIGLEKDCSLAWLSWQQLKGMTFELKDYLMRRWFDEQVDKRSFGDFVCTSWPTRWLDLEGPLTRPLHWCPRFGLHSEVFLHLDLLLWQTSRWQAFQIRQRIQIPSQDVSPRLLFFELDLKTWLSRQDVDYFGNKSYTWILYSKRHSQHPCQLKSLWKKK